MDRCEVALRCREDKYNCAQSVAIAFADLVGQAPEEAAAAMSGFGGGVGGSHEELCGALSGGAYVLSLLYADPADRGGHGTAYPQVLEFRRRFGEAFGHTRCGDLRDVPFSPTEKTPAGLRLGVEKPCDLLVVTAVEILEGMLAEQEQKHDG